MMTIKKKIIIEAKEGTNLGLKVATALTEAGIYAVTRKNLTPEIFTEVKRDRVNALLVDTSTQEMTEAFEEMLISRRTNVRVFVIVAESNPPIVENGGILFLSASLGVTPITDLIRYCLTATGQHIDHAIGRLLLSIGIQPNLKGYRYLTVAVKKVLYDPDLIENVNYELYVILSEIFHAKPLSIERSIRNAIELAYQNNSKKAFTDFFGYPVGKPGNTEFIATLSERIRLEIT